MNRFLQIVGAAALAWSVVSADYRITSPEDVTWRAGTSHQITWKVNGTAPEIFSIYLMYGKKTALQTIGRIADEIESSKEVYPWWINATTPSGSEYAIRIGDGPDAKYSHYFTISNPGQKILTSYVNEPATKTESQTPIISAPNSSSFTSAPTHEANPKNDNDKDGLSSSSSSSKSTLAHQTSSKKDSEKDSSSSSSSSSKSAPTHVTSSKKDSDKDSSSSKSTLTHETSSPTHEAKSKKDSDSNNNSNENKEDTKHKNSGFRVGTGLLGVVGALTSALLI